MQLHTVPSVGNGTTSVAAPQREHASWTGNEWVAHAVQRAPARWGRPSTSTVSASGTAIDDICPPAIRPHGHTNVKLDETVA